MRPQTAQTLVVLCAAVALTACVAAPISGPSVQLSPPNGPPAPEPWSQVALGEVSGETSLTPLVVQPVQALGETLAQRLGSEGVRPVGLRVENVRAAYTPGQGLSGATLIGLGADFVLSKDGSEKRLRLEHTVNYFALTEDEQEKVYRALLDGLCDQLLFHPEALGFLGGSAQVTDTVLESGIDVGPALPTEATETEIEGSGRILWGRKDSADNGVATVIIGLKEDQTMYGVLGGVSGRSAKRMGKSAFAFGSRYGGSLGALILGMDSGGSTSSNMTMFMTSFRAGLELGMMRTVYDPLGYVERPGISILFVPQATANIMFGSMTLPSYGGYGGGSASIRMTNVMFGAGGELDLPIGSHFGLTAGLLLGATLSSYSMSMSSGPSPDGSSSFSPTFIPSLDLYIQTATGRISLGMAFQQIAGAVQSASSSESEDSNGPLPDTLNLVFTYESLVGRGIGYSSTGIQIGGISPYGQTDVLSTPRSAFRDQNGAPKPAVIASVSQRYGQSAAGGAPQRAQGAGPATGTWVLLQRVDEELGADVASALADLVREEVAARSGSVVSLDETAHALRALDLEQPDAAALPEMVAALSAAHVLLLAVRGDATTVRVRVHRLDAGGRLTIRELAATPATLVSVVRAELRRLLPAAAPVEPQEAVRTNAEKAMQELEVYED